jgi:cell division protein ZapA (FtsZ GTPase activity inhibitor)
MPEARVVKVEIHGHVYPIKTTLDSEYVHRLAEVVDARMQQAAQAAPSSDILGLAVLVALNIADECERLRESHASTDGTLARRTAELERIVDQALALGD